MLITANKFINMPVMSLQTGAELARTEQALIDPRNLTIIAYSLHGSLLNEHPAFVRVNDIREIGSMGMIIDSTDEIVGLNDVLRIKEVYDFDFTLEGTPVIDEKKHKLGKVIGYTLDNGGFILQQLRVKRPLLQSFSDTELLIHRSQIIKVKESAIIVQSLSNRKPEPVKQPSAIKPVYENPFRKPEQQPQPDTAQSSQ